MEKIETIKDLYFIQKKSATEIADIINISISYISRIVRKDERYIEEKERRKNETLIKRREKQKELIYKQKKFKVNDDATFLQKIHEQDVAELSKHSTISNVALRKWCSSAYRYNSKKKCYEFKSNELTRPADFPLYIKA